jgi:hypothetical protein
MLDNFIKECTADPSSKTTEESGSGKYASVWKTEMPGIVIKTLKNPSEHFNVNLFDDGWLMWAINCMNAIEENPFLPKIYSLKIDYDNGKCTAVMENLKLDTSKVPYLSFDSESILCQEVQDILKKKNIPHSIIQTIINFSGPYLKDLYIDAHDENWLMRGEQIVLTDPYNMLNTLRKSPTKLFEYNQYLVQLAKGNPNIEIVGSPKKIFSFGVCNEESVKELVKIIEINLGNWKS